MSVDRYFDNDFMFKNDHNQFLKTTMSALCEMTLEYHQ